jgi:hypothetical protein
VPTPRAFIRKSFLGAPASDCVPGGSRRILPAECRTQGSSKPTDGERKKMEEKKEPPNSPLQLTVTIAARGVLRPLRLLRMPGS